MDTDAILTLLQETAAELITPRFRGLSAGQVMEKEPGDLVTVADREAEVAITRVLREHYPDALILGEEATATQAGLLTAFAGAEHAFTIDPVDGTKNFVNGSPDHAVMVSELRGGRAVRGWIWQPEHQLAYVAEAGAGVYRNGDRLTALPRSSDPAGIRGASSTELHGMTPEPFAEVRDSWWCAGVDYAQLLVGGADYLLFRRDWPWDHVPGALMVAELGGRTGRLDGTAYDPRVRQDWLLSAATEEVFEQVRGPVTSTLGLPVR